MSEEKRSLINAVEKLQKVLKAAKELKKSPVAGKRATKETEKD